MAFFITMRNALILILLTGCASSTPTPPAAEGCNSGMALLNASLWVQSSAEFKAAARQTYNMAARELDAALAGTTGPSAVILDLDETVLDNSAFETRMIREGKSYNADEWRTWVSEATAKEIPGAKEFLLHARDRGVAIFYITNRKADEEADTRRNLELLGLPISSTEDNVLTRGDKPEWPSNDKSPRREWVASRYRVLMMIGDDLNDFVSANDKSMAERNAIVASNAGKWGSTWFVVPNPMYGSWEKTITGTTAECAALQKKLGALR